VGVDLLPGERVLWRGSPVRRSVFLRHDLRWMRFSLKFGIALFVLLTVGLFAALALVVRGVEKL